VKSKTRERVPSLLRLQAELGSAYAKSRLLALQKLAAPNPLDFNRLSSLSQPQTESHMWLQVVARDPTMRMTDRVVRHAACYRLGLNPYPNLPPVCLCGKPRPYHSNHYHALSCRVLSTRGTNVRHNLIAKNVTSWLRRAGLNVEREVEGMSSDDNKRPDIVFWHNYQQHVVDVTVTDPLNQTNTRRVGSVPQRLTASAAEKHAVSFDAITAFLEKRKNKHYKKLVQINQAVFHTAAACTTGVLGKEFRRLVELVSSIAQEELGGWDPAEIIAGIRGSTAVAIQVGNTVVLEQSWIALAKRDASQLLRSGDARRRSTASIRGSALAPAPAPAVTAKAACRAQSFDKLSIADTDSEEDEDAVDSESNLPSNSSRIRQGLFPITSDLKQIQTERGYGRQSEAAGRIEEEAELELELEDELVEG
jgi:hypothetical protein